MSDDRPKGNPNANPAITADATVVGDFTRQAEAYAEARPSYPDALLDRLMVGAGVQRGDAVADIGAGTGISALAMAQRGLRVIAIEPNAAMREQASRWLTSKGDTEAIGRIRWRDGSFDRTGLGDESIGWAIAAQAFHWASPQTALPELARVLKPGGCFTAWWNDRDVASSEILQAVCGLIHLHAPGFQELYRDRDWSEVLTATGDFDTVKRDEQTHTVAMSRQRFMNLWRSHNRLNAQAGPEAMRELLRSIEAWLTERKIETVPVPYRCQAWTAKRVSSHRAAQS